MNKKKIAIVFGTRPEAIKMAPVILELRKYTEVFETCVIVTAQHREMLDQVLNVFNIKPDYDLNIMRTDQVLSDITADVLKGIESVIIKERPDMVLVHGDTTTSFSAALAAYYHKIPIGHVEAGLRTHDKYFPFPEEANRQLIDTIADIFFVPTATSKENLIRENKDKMSIVVTGNTVIDAIHYTKERNIEHPILDLMDAKPEEKWLLLTMHRRENRGKPMENVFKAVLELLSANRNLEVIMPVHLSPVVQKLSHELLGSSERVHLIDPLEVDVFHKVMDKSYLVMTDSGGLQEEAPALDKPVIVLRDKTERPEGLASGTLKVVGTDKERVVSAVDELLNNEEIYDKMSKAHNPYGDGFASARIKKAIVDYFEKETGGK